MRLVVLSFSICTAAMLLSSCGAQPLTCDVDINSPDGGRIELVKTDHSRELPFRIPLQLIWHPASKTNVWDIAVGYSGSKVEHLGDPSGGHLSFTIPVTVEVNSYVIRISTDTGENWSFGPNDIRSGRDQAGIVFDRNDVRGRGILAAIRDGKQIKVEISSNGKIEKSDIIDTSNTKARDILIDRAMHMIEAADSTVCRPIKSVGH